MKFLVLLLFLQFLLEGCEMTPQCKTIASVYGKYLKNHVMSTSTVTDLLNCTIKCDFHPKCKSWNFLLNEKKCQLNDADRYTHPQDYQDKASHIYCDTAEPLKKKSYKSCAEVKQAEPGAQSDYYWIKIKDRELQVYCDMDNYGGGWTLVVSISSNNNDHLQRAQHNCSNSVLCVPFTNVTIPGRKLSDGDIQEIGVTEGTFRVEDLTDQTNTVFYKIPSGVHNFDSSCRLGTCPRIMISYSHPYAWESNNCSLGAGYKIRAEYHSVFDGHDDEECGEEWKSSEMDERRILYGYANPNPFASNNGLAPNNQQGLLFVK